MSRYQLDARAGLFEVYLSDTGDVEIEVTGHGAGEEVLARYTALALSDDRELWAPLDLIPASVPDIVQWAARRWGRLIDAEVTLLDDTPPPTPSGQIEH